MARVIVLDASVLIAHFKSDEAHHDRAGELLLDAAEHDMGASSITLAEALVHPARAGRLDEVRAAIRDIDIAEIPIPWGAAERLASLRVDARVKLPDCCVLLAAQDVAADAVLTFDDRLERSAHELGFATKVPRPADDEYVNVAQDEA